MTAALPFAAKAQGTAAKLLLDTDLIPSGNGIPIRARGAMHTREMAHRTVMLASRKLRMREVSRPGYTMTISAAAATTKLLLLAGILDESELPIPVNSSIPPSTMENAWVG
jgi:hypothetical protein